MSGRGIRIAVVDDDASVCRALSRLLRTYDFTVATYASAREFLDSLAGPVPHCLVVDMKMPGMTGLQLHQHLVHAGLHIPAILITTCADTALVELSRTAGGAHCLEKPLQEESLLAAIEAAVAVKLTRQGPES
jgi:FixJ family two-component response regulator